MQDFISNGNGDSRYLKSVSDFLTRYPTYEDFAAALMAGTLPIDMNGYNPNGIMQRGTPYNKANVLTDATAALLGLEQSNPTVNDALAALASGAGGGTILFAECDTAANVAEKVVTVDRNMPDSDFEITVKFNNGNTVTQTNALYLTVNFNNNSQRRIISTSSVTAFAPEIQFPAGTIISLVMDQYVSSGGTLYMWKVKSVGKNSQAAYQTRGVYTGTGSYGYDSPVRISTIGFPVLGVIMSPSGKDFGIYANQEIRIFSDGEWSRATANAGNNEFVLYSTESAAKQLNISGVRYSYAFLMSAN